MANLAIKGHPTRGKEVIEILEILGGCNKHNYTADCDSLCFYISTGINIIYYDWVNNCCEDKDILVFTLEEFLQKYPYMVGDKVIYHECEAVVTSMEWNGDEVSYIVLHKGIKWQTTVFYLKPCKKETMEESMDKTNKVIMEANTQCCDIMNDIIKKEIMEENTDIALNLKGEDSSGKRFVYKIPNGYEFDCIKNNEIILKLKQPKYPKTYLECAKILGCFGASAYIDGYKGRLLGKLQELIICRDAYWKIAGDWKPDFLNPTKEIRYFFFCTGITIEEGQGLFPTNKVLIFPTEEMRDAFYDNFEELIKECKDFL